MDVMFQVSRGRSRSHGNCAHVVVGRAANTIDICIRWTRLDVGWHTPSATLTFSEELSRLELFKSVISNSAERIPALPRFGQVILAAPDRRQPYAWDQS